MDADRSIATPPRKRGGVVGVVLVVMVGLVVLVLAIAAFPIVLDRTACSAAEQRVFAEFPRYGGIRRQPSGQADAGSCMATYRAPTSDEGALAYYQWALGTRGWTLPPPQTNAGSDLQGREFRSGELSARRGDYTYAVLYELEQPSRAVAPTWPCTSPRTEPPRDWIAGGRWRSRGRSAWVGWSWDAPYHDHPGRPLAA